MSFSFPKTIIQKLKYGFSLFCLTTLIFSIDFIFSILRSNIIYDMDVLGWIYYIISAIGHASIFALLLYMLFYIPFAVLFRNYIIPTTIYSVFAIILQSLFVLDCLIFSIYKFHLNGFVLELFLGGGTTDVFVFDFWIYIKFFIVILLTSVLPIISITQISKKLYQKLKKSRLLLFPAL